MTLESITLAKVMEGFECLEALLETRNALEEGAEGLAKEEETRVETTQEDVVVYEDTPYLCLKQAARQQDERQRGESVVQEAEKGVRRAASERVEAMAEVEASLETPENESLSKATDNLEREADRGEVEGYGGDGGL
ncbi:hypothetical protein KUCAC02_035945 [Chaenocephalus aceratus]|nr:hypothetical protein KUCAC02_035945 [Chaenocephalus aceratus]